MDPSPDAVRQQLERILSREPFAGAGRLSRLLRYIVDRTLAGEGNQLKEYVLGVDVFDRGDKYDPRLDSIVRVEARRLRSKLEEYYVAAGAGDPIEITVPRGSYLPVFVSRVPGLALSDSLIAGVEGLQPSTVPAPPASRVPTVGVALFGLFTAVVLLLISSLAWRSGASSSTVTPVAVGVLPFESHLTDPEDATLASRLTDNVTAELARLGTVGVVSRTSARQFEGQRRPLREIAQALNADVVMEASVAMEGDQLRVTARLVDARTDRKMWVEDFFAPRTGLSALARRIAEASALAAMTKRPPPPPE